MNRLASVQGQSLVEALAVLPVVISSFSLFFGLVIFASAVFILESHLEETLVCLSFRPREVCEKQWKDFSAETGFSYLRPSAEFNQEENRWRATLEFNRPWGGRFRVQRELLTPLSENFR